MNEREQGRKSPPELWVSTTYFAEGFPYTIVNTLSEVLFKEHGASLKAIGMTSLLHLPWNLKFLWGPFLDEFATKRKWLVWTEIALVALLLILSLVTTLPQVLISATVCLALVAVISATHDIAIDGFYLEALDKSEQARHVGLRVAAYRVSMFTVSGPCLYLIGHYGWSLAFLASTAIVALLLVFHAVALPKAEHERKPVLELLSAIDRLKLFLVGMGLALVIAVFRLPSVNSIFRDLFDRMLEAAPFLQRLSSEDYIGLGFLVFLLVMLAMLPGLRGRLESRDSFYARAFLDFLAQPKVAQILAFVVLFRTGESYLLKMRYAFLRDIGMTVEEFSFAGGTLGVAVSIAATWLGGRLISRYGLKRCIWPFVLAQNLLHFLYVGVSWMHVEQVTRWPDPPSFELLATIVSVEAFGAGLGTSVFMVYLMRCCRPSYKAAHMAILTALMSLSFTLAGMSSGFLAEWMGYTHYFAFTFAAAIPGMILIYFIPYLDGSTAADLPEHPAS